MWLIFTACSRRTHLAFYRNVVEEICLWAQARLVRGCTSKDSSRIYDSLQTQNDGRWSQIRNGLIIGKEIDEFKARVTDAKKLFMVSVCLDESC